jgi:hypothetical protein
MMPQYMGIQELLEPSNSPNEIVGGLDYAEK